ncbi:MAG: LamG domain-containing protein, partial [Alphaproteobacteria bacterium]|nr:LamG domain-containing protein [Alphaproteobacteria bacterium]
MMNLRALLHAGLFVLSLCAAGASARADCTDPAGVGGDIAFNAPYGAMMHCDGAVWQSWAKQERNYSATAMLFDGTNTYIRQNAIPDVTDSKMVTGSVWIKRNATGAIHNIFAINDRFIFRVTSAGQIAMVAENASDTDILDMVTTANVVADTNWHHVIFSIDMGNSANNRIYVDGVSAALSYSINTDAVIDFSVTQYAVGAVYAGTNKFNGMMSDLWIDVGRFVDLTVAANREKFRSSAGLPQYLGVSGERP